MIANLRSFDCWMNSPCQHQKKCTCGEYGYWSYGVQGTLKRNFSGYGQLFITFKLFLWNNDGLSSVCVQRVQTKNEAQTFFVGNILLSLNVQKICKFATLRH